MSNSLNPSIWEDEIQNASPLDRDLTVSVCVVGAGIAGMTTAYLLARQGRTVAVLDDGPIGGGETRHTTAHLSNAIDNRYVEMLRIHGPERTHLIAESHTAAINRIEQIVNAEQIACDFARVNGYLFLPPGGDPAFLDQELAAAHAAGLTHVEKLDEAPIMDFNTGPCLLFPDQAQFHPIRYLRGLHAAIERDGGAVFTGSHVTAVLGGSDACVTTSSGHKVHAEHVVVATNTPVNDTFGPHTKQAPYLTYVICAEIPAGSAERALFWDTLDPYHFIRIQPGNGKIDYLIVGGEDHKTGEANDAPERFFRLERWTRERFPMILSVPFRWSGQVMETIDGLAFIGRNPHDHPNVYIATGDSGMGMTHGTIAGILLSDLILQRENRWVELYSPSRRRAGALREFAKDNLSVAAHYVDYITGGDVSKEAAIAPGCGAILREGVRKLAVYRDESGACHKFSAICPHLRCIVHWNSLEKTWDCPCHGSRFSALGEVLNGPAISNLTPVHEPAHVP